MQQATPQNLLQDDYQIAVHQDSDTAYPRSVVPIFYIHAGDAPFCTNLRCFCQRGKRAGAILYQDVAAGKLLLAQYSASGQFTITDQPHRVHVSLIEGIPEECQLYGHTWELTKSPDVKECVVCLIRGFCPGCTPMPPGGAQPFTCTAHTGRQGEQ